MARPIEPTPPLEGKDAQRLLADLDKGCDAREWQRRLDNAERALGALLNQPITLQEKKK